MAELKTRMNDDDPKAFIASIQDEQRRSDSLEALEIFRKITMKPPKMWGAGIIGFGSYHYKYESGREGDWMLTGFSPRKQALTLYIMPGFRRYEKLMSKLGKYKTGKSCLYIKKLQDVDREVLEELITLSVEHMRKSDKK